MIDLFNFTIRLPLPLELAITTIPHLTLTTQKTLTTHAQPLEAGTGAVIVSGWAKDVSGFGVTYVNGSLR